jgi:hypothetical protein
VHSYGAYYGGTYGVAPIRLPNATKIVARNAAATVDMSIVATDAANDVLLGAGVTASIVMGAGTALAATATAGLLELPYMAAAPTGAPAGAAPLCTYNTASHSLDCHDAGGWYHVTLTSGAS